MLQATHAGTGRHSPHATICFIYAVRLSMDLCRNRAGLRADSYNIYYKWSEYFWIMEQLSQDKAWLKWSRSGKLITAKPEQLATWLPDLTKYLGRQESVSQAGGKEQHSAPAMLPRSYSSIGIYWDSSYWESRTSVAGELCITICRCLSNLHHGCGSEASTTWCLFSLVSLCFVSWVDYQFIKSAVELLAADKEYM